MAREFDKCILDRIAPPELPELTDGKISFDDYQKAFVNHFNFQCEKAGKMELSSDEKDVLNVFIKTLKDNGLTHACKDGSGG